MTSNVNLLTDFSISIHIFIVVKCIRIIQGVGSDIAAQLQTSEAIPSGNEFNRFIVVKHVPGNDFRKIGGNEHNVMLQANEL